MLASFGKLLQLKKALEILKPHHLFVPENPSHESSQHQTLLKTCKVLTRAPDWCHNYKDFTGAITFRPSGFIE